MILLFGGAGQLGQEISRVALKRNIGLKSLARGEADISDPEQVADAIRMFRPGLVVNAAAYTDVDRAEEESEAAFLANAQGPGIVAAACRSADIPLLHVSTDYVFDGTKQGAYVETDPVAPLGVYGRSKAAGEERVRSESPMHLILRTSWVYGEFGRNFLKTILRLARERSELRVVADQWGNPTSTPQIANAIFSIAPRLLDRTGPWGTYHFAGSGATTWHAFAEKIVTLQTPHTGRRPEVVPISTAEHPTKAKRPLNSMLDCKLFARTFGLEPEGWAGECERVIAALCGTRT